MSTARLSSYQREMGSDQGAVALYEWNLQVSGALFETLGAVEVLIRNAFHRQLANRYADHVPSGNWYDGQLLDDKGRRDVLRAKERATRGGRQVELPGKVIAELTFGFWRYLIAKRYQATAWPALRMAFPHHPNGVTLPRSDVDDRVQRVHVLRNRIAHHEPVFRRDLAHDHADMLDLVGWIDPGARTWVESLSRVTSIIAGRPRRES